jgi:hypothetical protein
MILKRPLSPEPPKLLGTPGQVTDGPRASTKTSKAYREQATRKTEFPYEAIQLYYTAVIAQVPSV